MTTPHVLIVGAGSAGRRHARNLHALGCDISAFDPRADRLADLAGEVTLRVGHTSLEAALEVGVYNGYLIASPPSAHTAQVVRVAQRGGWVMCEKPIGVSVSDAEPLRALVGRLLLTYTYRWWPPVIELRRRLLAGQIGTIRNMRFVMSAHLADWHPWEPYEQFFMASGQLGGGALLDESHFVDLMIWMLGMPSSVMARVQKLSDLKIDSDDTVDIVATFTSGANVNLHLDLVGRPHRRSITAVGEDGTLEYVYEDNVLRIGHGATEWEAQHFTCERNEMFAAAAAEFVDLLRGTRTTPSCGVEDGLRVLKVVDACRESSRAGREIELPA